MKHQWEVVHGVKDRIGCGYCSAYLDGDLNLAISMRMAALTEECPGWKTEATTTETTELTELTAELVSPDVLTQITEDLWVNPSAVGLAQIGRREKSFSQGFDFEDDPASTRLLVHGIGYGVAKPLHEVVALLNGSA